MEWGGYWSLHCHMRPPSSKWCPHCAAPLQAYERKKHERKCPGKEDGSEVNWEMNELKRWSKRILQIPEMGTNCLWQCWTDIVGCDRGVDFTTAWPNSAGWLDMAISVHGTLITGLFGPILCRCQTVSRMQTEAGVQVGGDLSVPCLGRSMLPQVWWGCCVFFWKFSEFIGIFLEFFDFVGEILCGCWNILNTPTGVGEGSFRAEFRGKHVLTGYVGGYYFWWVNWWGVCG